MSRTSTLVLGAGMVGSAMVEDLVRDERLSVTVADRSPAALAAVAARCGAATVVADLSDPAVVGALAAKHDLVAGALSSRIALAALRAVIEAGRPCVDISFMADDALELDALARRHGVPVVVDCGVAPGLSHMLCGHAAARMEPCERLQILVGGLPVVRRWPYEYKAGFAPHDVIEEYARPARLVEGGRLVVREALSEPELVDLPGVGTLEAFNTDGLRSLVSTLSVPEMSEKTLRYPGHIALMATLRATGLLSATPLSVPAADGRGQVTVRPLDVTAALLFPLWTYAPGEADLTVMRVSAEGRLDGRRQRLVWDLLDHHDAASDTRSMSRTTAWPATIVARWLAEGRFARPGVHAPEVLGAEPELMDAMLAGLRERGVTIEARCEPLPDDRP